MADENLKIDENTRWVLGAVTNDGFQYIKNVRVNPITGALICEANVTSSNTSIGSTIPGGTAGSVLFLGLGSTLAQDNANFFYDDTNNYLGLGTNTPTETLDVQGTANITGDTGTADQLLGRDSGTGGISGVTVGSGLSLSAGILSATGGGGTGYDLIQNQGVSVTQRTTINLSDLLLATDVAGKTALTIDVAALATDATFITDLIANTTFTTNLAGDTNFTTTLANDTNFISTLTSNTTFISDIVTIVNSDPSISIDLTSQVTGILPIANGGTNSSTALSGSTIMISNGSAIVQGTAGTTTTVLHGNAGGAPSYGAVVLTTDVSGVLPLANGGTGSNLSDPGANKLLGWDDTDNSVGFWTIGSGLSYDHSTHTLSSTSGSTFTVNTDETVSTWYTIPIASPFSGSVATETFWTTSGTLVPLATGSTLTSSGAMYAYGALQDMATGSTGGALNFAAGTSIRVKNIVLLPQGTDVSGGGNYRSSFFGFSESGTADSGDITDVGIRRVGFGAYNGNLYAICGTGAAITSTSLGAYATDINNLYEIILNGTTSADFYINGSLVATISTNLPSASPIYIQLQRTNSPGGSYTMFMSNLTYSQEL